MKEPACLLTTGKIFTPFNKPLGASHWLPWFCPVACLGADATGGLGWARFVALLVVVITMDLPRLPLVRCLLSRDDELGNRDALSARDR